MDPPWVMKMPGRGRRAQVPALVLFIILLSGATHGKIQPFPVLPVTNLDASCLPTRAKQRYSLNIEGLVVDSSSPPLVRPDYGMVYLQAKGSTIWAANYASGSTAWNTSISIVNTTTNTVVVNATLTQRPGLAYGGGRLYGLLYVLPLGLPTLWAVNASTGTTLWTRNLLLRGLSMPIYNSEVS